MKKEILIVTAAVSLVITDYVHADEPKSLIKAINAVDDARQALIADLALNHEGRDEFASCPSESQFAKILKDEKIYNEAVKTWFIEVKKP
jgi:hypothetical protein